MDHTYVFLHETAEGLGVRTASSLSKATADRQYFASHGCPTSQVLALPQALADAPAFRETVLALVTASRGMHSHPGLIDENR